METSLKPLTPIDWPGSGPIDLEIHDLPHASSGMEWWYVNTHLSVSGGREFSLFAAFFRVETSQAGQREKVYSHFLTWGLVDVQGKRFHPHTLLDKESPATALRELNDGHGPRDERVARAFREILEQGKIPLPDLLLRKDPQVDTHRLSLDLDGNRFVRRDDGSYDLELAGENQLDGCNLHFTLEKPVVRHGDDGVVRGLAGQEMFYYFSPRCRVEGSLQFEGKTLDIKHGSGWYDHEFGEHRSVSGRSEAKISWNWLAAQLDNGYDVSAYDLIDNKTLGESRGRWVIVIDPSGKRQAYSDFTFEASDLWTSTRTFNEYPTHYRLEVKGAGLTLDISATLQAQEIMTILSPPGFWEGRVAIKGSMNGTPVSGRGFVERSGFSSAETTDDFFSSIGRETRRAVNSLLPEHLTPESALPLIGGEGRPHFLDGLDLDQYSRTILQPLREMIFRGGKAWRSYGILSCMDLVGGDSQPFAQWLALPELLHVGSLIIDDVQDGSEVRRGGPSCHRLYGVALAINAGCAAYFLAQIPIGTSGLADSMRVQIYEAYFNAVRAAHAGQAFDIDGLISLMPEVVENGNGEWLERRVLGTHRLKSAAPPAAIARMAALIGGGTAEQAEGVGNLFEAFGLAFQIIDDVLNLRGFEEDRKSRGEDISHGKVTAPVAKAMGRLSLADRRTLWAIINSKPTEFDQVRKAIQLIEGCGALQACEDQAHELVESAWRKVAPMIPDSQFKIRMRSFGWFVLDRHY